MKIAIIRQKYVNYGGAENFAAQYTRFLADSGYEVHVFANQWKSDEHPNLHFHKVPAVRLNSFLRTLTFAWNAAREVRKHRFDIVQSHERTWEQDIYRAGDGCHREWLEQRKKHAPFWKRLSLAVNPFHRLVLVLEKGIFEKNRCRRVIAISNMVKEDILRHYKISPDKITVVYNGVDLDRFHPKNKALFRRSIREKLGIGEEDVMILFVGSGDERKGVKTLIHSVRYLKHDNWRLVLMGRGNKKRLREIARSDASRKIIPLEPVDNIEQYYGAADIFVLPSIYEPFGNVHLEALASGLPIVAGSHSGAAEIIRHRENGLILDDPSDPRELAERMNSLWDSGIRESLGREGRRLAERFSLARNLQEMLEVYQDVIQRKQDHDNLPLTKGAR